ncbi:MAG TPA: hypothetical protein VGC65_11635 [Bacteroidia bacterium]|jgi:hypothetical protein
MKSGYVKLFVLQLLCSFAFASYSQPTNSHDSLISSKISDLKIFWKKYNDLSTARNTYESYSTIPGIYSIHKDSSSLVEYQQKVYDAKLNLLRQDIGIEGTGSYLENFNPGLNSDDNLIYHRKFQAGIDWNILSDGYISSRYKQQILKNENTISSLRPNTKMNGEEYVAISHKIIYAFNIHKIRLIEKRKEIIDDKIAIANELYLLKHLPRIELLKIMQQEVEVGSMNQIYRSYNEQLALQIDEKSIPKNVLPVFDVDISKAFSFNGRNSVNDSILKLQIENLELAHKPLSDIRLNTQLRYNYYDLVSTTTASRNFLSAGLGLSVPIPLGIKANKELVTAQSKLLEYQQRESAVAGQTDLLSSFYDFRYKLKQYNNFLEKRKQYEELIRVERVKEKFGDYEFNPLSALNLLDELLSVDIELLDLQQEMYLQLLDINAKIPGSEVISFIKPYKTDTLAKIREKTEKALYIWSEAQTKYSAQYIEEYVRMNAVSTAIISLRKDQANKEEAALLFEKFNASGIKTELLIGNNKLLSVKDPNAYFDSITNGINLSTIKAIHLDVEPHVLDDYDSNKEKYLNQYVELLKKTKTYCTQKGLALSVSIPVFYPEPILKQIYAQANNVYLMAYEHPDADFIIRKVKEEFAIDPAKTVIALRAKDFKNRNECEKLISELTQTLSIFRFALHDLETFVKLDEQNIMKEK